MAVLERRSLPRQDSRELRLVAAWTEFDLDNSSRQRKRFHALAEEGKEDADEMRLAATLSAFHAKDWATATGEFTRSARGGTSGDPAAVRYTSAEFRKTRSGGQKPSIATRRCRRVSVIGNRSLLANALAQDKQLLQAAAHLRALKPASAFERSSRAQAESALWRDAGENQKAFDAIDAALMVDADDADLLYESAMLCGAHRPHGRGRKAPAPGDCAAAETCPCLQRPITVLLIATSISTKRTLIEKAHDLAPMTRPFSTAWVGSMFRQGRMNDAESYLKRAYEKFQTARLLPTLARCCGLWAQG